MNSYEQKQEAKREGLREAAEKRRQASEAKHAQGKQMAEAIPFGQPILIGHHSEKSDRAYRSKIHNTFGKAFELSKEADKLARRAEAVGTGGVSSDDPEAVAKLSKTLAAYERDHQTMLTRNQADRKEGKPATFPAYALTNNGANIRRIKQRIALLQKHESAPAMAPIEGNGWKIYEDKEDNRIVVQFFAKPSTELCKGLRSCGFLWSPNRAAWVRKAVNAGYAVRRATELLQAN